MQRRYDAQSDLLRRLDGPLLRLYAGAAKVQPEAEQLARQLACVLLTPSAVGSPDFEARFWE